MRGHTHTKKKNVFACILRDDEYLRRTSVKMSSRYKVAELKDKLRELNLSTTGTKAELLKRLHEVDPSGDWPSEDPEMFEPGAIVRDELDVETMVPTIDEREIEMLRREKELVERELRREKELAEREMQVMRREIELLKEAQRSITTNRDQPMERESIPRDISESGITAIAHLLGYFDGSTGDYQSWELQLKLLKKTYRLSDDCARILIGMRLKGRAAEWLKSVAAHIEMSFDDLLTKLRKMYDHRPSRVNLLKLFQEREWKRDETFHQYVHEKVTLANRIPIPEDDIVEYLIDGIPVENLRDQARVGDITTVERLLKVFEKVSMKSKIPASGSGNAERRRQSGGKQQQIDGKTDKKATATNERRAVTSSKAERRCFNCGERDHTAAGCPTKVEGPKCFKCSERGHVAAKCEKKKSEQSIVNVDVNMIERRDKIVKDVIINNCVMSALIDTGSDICLMRASAYIRVGSPRLEPKEIRFRGVGASDNSTLGEFNTELTIDGRRYFILLRIVSDTLISHDLIVGVDFLNSVELTITGGKSTISPLPERACTYDLPEILQIDFDCEKNDVDVSHVLQSEHREKVRRLVREYKPSKTREIDLKMSIVLRDDEPVYQRARRLAMPERENVNAQINEWMRDGIVQPSLSDYASPVVLTKKKNGFTRLCVDYRQLNKKIIKDRYPLPLIEDQLDQLQDAKIFSTLDLRNGFFHVKVHESSRKYTAFIVPDGHYEFLRVPFGLCNSPAIFQRFINIVFKDLIRVKIVLTYLDDLIIPSIDYESGIQNLEIALRVASEAGLVINWQKCSFLKERVEFLGHIIENGCISPSERKVEAIKCFPELTNIKRVQSYLGLSGYFRKFIPHYSVIARPLSNLLRANVKFEFGDEERKAYLRLKEILCTKPVLKLYEIGAPTELHTDASIHGYGAILLQKSKVDNEWHPVYYSSNKTTPAEQKYSSYELEVLAIVKALKKFRVYLLGIQFTIVTDCRAFVATMNKKDLCVRVARWALLLEEFQYTVEHRPGRSMKHVDALSRNPSSECNVIDAQKEGLTSRLRKAQLEDNDIKRIFDLVKSGKANDYVVRENLLFRQDNGELLVVVPRTMQTQVIRQAHEKGHFSVTKTEAILRSDYWIPNVKFKIEKVIRNCVACILAERKRGKQEGFLNTIDKGEVPLDTYHIDHLGPLPSTKKSYKHIFVVIDAFSKFVWFYATKSTGTNEVLDKLSKQASIFGNPRRIISDRGTAFTSHEFLDYCSGENIEHVLITAGIPRANGQVERVNRTLIPLLTKLADPKKDEWYKYLESAQKYMNTTLQRSIGTDPFRLIFGTKARLKDNPEIRELIESEWREMFQKERDELRERAVENIAKVQQENRHVYNKKRVATVDYKEGDLVAIKRTQRGPGLKLANKFLGPYKIIRVLRNNRYIVQREGNHEGPYETSTSSDNIKPWISADELDDEFNSETVNEHE